MIKVTFEREHAFPKSTKKKKSKNLCRFLKAGTYNIIRKLTRLQRKPDLIRWYKLYAVCCELYIGILCMCMVYKLQAIGTLNYTFVTNSKIKVTQV